MGNTIIPLGNGGDEGTSLWMKAALIAIDEEHYRKVANAKGIDTRTYTSRQHQDYLKPDAACWSVKSSALLRWWQMPPSRVLTLNPLPYKTSCKKCVACFCCKAAVPAALQQRKVA
ncbi:MAG: hypothetical protein V7K38_18055 [Nostoc sp.]|uniref:hypothetical protein n=1 Tax=Nostoc sp. TaxID=1180 RepID=UPI002FF8360D